MPDDSVDCAQISNIVPGRRRGRFNIHIDGEFALAVGEKVMIELGLKVGQTFDRNALKSLASAAEKERAITIALRYLEVRPRSRREVEQRLYRDAIEKETIDSVMSKLVELNLIDDADFAHRWIESRNRTRPKSVRSLKAELSLKGIAKDEIETAVQSISPDDEVELARAALAKHIGTKRTSPTTKAEQDSLNKKSVSFLQRRGFSWSTIKSAMALSVEGFDADESE